MISIDHLTFYYNGASHAALSDIDLRIADGEFVLITGPSGGGKSSLCRCFNGLIPHFYGGQISGRIEVQGMNPIEESPKMLATKVGMIFQDPENQLVAMDVEREIAFPMENLAFPRNLIARRVEESLDTLGIAHLRYRPIHELSGGEKQKVAIASVLALHPDVLVLDEPTSELDPKSAEDVLAIVQRLNDELGITIILIEHRLDRVVHLVDRILIVDEGRIVANGNPREILGSTETTDVGIGIPPIIRLARELRKRDVPIDEIPLTVKEARLMLTPVFGMTNGTLESAQVKHNGAKPVVEVHRLWHAYSQHCVALKGIDCSIGTGEFVAVMGRNASGKTTLLKHTNGLLKPTKGKVQINGIDTGERTVAQLARDVGFGFQNPNDHLFCDTVEDEIAFTLKTLGFSSEEREARIAEMLEAFQLERCRGKYPRALSGGERQRVALASVIAAKPRVLVLDEPTRGLDYRLKKALMAFLDDYRTQGNTVILISHDVETVAEHADRVILLSEGRVIVDGTTREVLSNALLFSPQINRLAQFFHRFDCPSDILTIDEMLKVLP